MTPTSPPARPASASAAGLRRLAALAAALAPSSAERLLGLAAGPDAAWAAAEAASLAARPRPERLAALEAAVAGMDPDAAVPEPLGPAALAQRLLRDAARRR